MVVMPLVTPSSSDVTSSCLFQYVPTQSRHAVVHFIFPRKPYKQSRCLPVQAMLCEKGFNTYAKSINPCQPAHSAQADMGRNLSLVLNFPRIKG